MNSVTKEHINNLMDSAEVRVSTTYAKTTIVSYKFPNGFVITESSSCVDPDNYSVMVGIKICKEKIRNKLWEFEGYLLAQKICDERNSPVDDDSDKDISHISVHYTNGDVDEHKEAVVMYLCEEGESDMAVVMCDVSEKDFCQMSLCVLDNFMDQAFG